MFENKTYENILQEMLNEVKTDVDKREGSVIYDALAPSALKLSEMYFELENYIDLFFADTAIGEYLDRKVLDFGMTRKKATKSIRKITTSAPANIGTIWEIENITFKIIEKTDQNIYKAECESFGNIGNVYSGKLKSVDNLEGVDAYLSDILESGQDEESDESLRIRFYNKVRKPSTSGNANHYEQWALEVEGIGAAKIFPLWNGAGTVKVEILDSNMNIDKTLETKVYEHIEKVKPIGATLTVSSPTQKLINIKAKVILDGSLDISKIKEKFEYSVNEYLKKLIFKSKSVSYAAIGSMLLSTKGVLDYSEFTLNESAGNILISEHEIPSLGNIVLEV